MKRDTGHWIFLATVFAIAIGFGIYFLTQAITCSNNGGTYIQPVYGWPTCIGTTK